jgi:hypothetical protein
VAVFSDKEGLLWLFLVWYRCVEGNVFWKRSVLGVRVCSNDMGLLSLHYK